MAYDKKPLDNENEEENQENEGVNQENDHFEKFAAAFEKIKHIEDWIKKASKLYERLAKQISAVNKAFFSWNPIINQQRFCTMR